MRFKSIYLLLPIIAACTGCISSKSAETATPNFSATILPALPQPQSTPTFELPALDAATPTLSAPVEGATTTQVNVRAQPSKESAALGILDVFTKVQIIGKDSSGGWYQINYADSFGWVSAAYVQVNAGVEIPFSATAEPSAVQPTESFPSAMPDGDSRQAPLAMVVFLPTGARALQLNGDVSAPHGDAEDWLQFTSYSRRVRIKAACPESGLQIELWDNATRVDDFLLACGGEKLLTVTPNRDYFLRFSAPTSNEFHYVNYLMRVESVQ